MSQIKVGPGETLDITLIENYELFKNTLPILENKICFISKWIDYKGTHYQAKMILILDYNYDTGPIFGEIVKIIVKNNRPLFLCYTYDTIGYNPHVHGYEISKNVHNMKIRGHENLFDPLPIYVRTISSSEAYCILRYSL